MTVTIWLYFRTGLHRDGGNFQKVHMHLQAQPFFFLFSFTSAGSSETKGNRCQRSYSVRLSKCLAVRRQNNLYVSFLKFLPWHLFTGVYWRRSQVLKGNTDLRKTWLLKNLYKEYSMSHDQQLQSRGKSGVYIDPTHTHTHTDQPATPQISQVTAAHMSASHAFNAVIYDTAGSGDTFLSELFCHRST